MKRITVIAFCFLISINLKAQFTISPAQTALQLATELAGSGVVISNISYAGADSANGIFQCSGACNIGISQGVILTTGWSIGAMPPNDYEGYTVDNQMPGDSDLNSIVIDSTYDACVLEFDFLAISDSVKFNYVFASEEYNEFVNTYNDAFAFLISGPGISGKLNMAIIPGTILPVTIDNVNNGNASAGFTPTGPCMNCNYYLDNTAGFFSTQYDGLTTVLQATAACIPGLTYHLKLVIADVLDYAYDSGVFLEQGSFSSTGPVAMKVLNQLANGKTITMCQGDSIQLSVPSGFNYLWSNGATTASIVVTSAGKYAVQISDSAATWSIFSDSVSFNVVTSGAAPTITYSNGQLIAALNSPLYQYSWSVNGNSIAGQNSPTLTPVLPGCYNVTIASASSCSGTSDTLCVSITGLPDVSILNEYKLLINGNLVTIDFGKSSGDLKIIRLLDQQGKQIKTITTNDTKTEFSVPVISSGIYLLMVSDNNGNQTKTRKIYLTEGN